jgi:hypothetical protein
MGSHRNFPQGLGKRAIHDNRNITMSREVIVQHQYPPPPRKGWFDRHQLLIMFILSTIGGGAVSTGYQLISHELVKNREAKEAERKERRSEQAAKEVRERELMAVKRAAARDFLEDFQDSAERRNYFAFRLISHAEDIQNGQDTPFRRSSFQEDRLKYAAACENWNLKRHSIERFLEIYLSPVLRRKFYDEDDPQCIVSQFIALHGDVLAAIGQIETGETLLPKERVEAAKKKREKLSSDLAAIYDDLLRMSMDESGDKALMDEPTLQK